MPNRERQEEKESEQKKKIKMEETEDMIKTMRNTYDRLVRRFFN
jgi:hypothetical protein